MFFSYSAFHRLRFQVHRVWGLGFWHSGFHFPVHYPYITPVYNHVYRVWELGFQKTLDKPLDPKVSDLHLETSEGGSFIFGV